MKNLCVGHRKKDLDTAGRVGARVPVLLRPRIIQQHRAARHPTDDMPAAYTAGHAIDAVSGHAHRFNISQPAHL
jgi:hypothetical protein